MFVNDKEYEIKYTINTLCAMANKIEYESVVFA